MTNEPMKLKKVHFDVHIPNLDGDGIAYTVPIEAEAYSDPETGEDVLTPEAVEEIEKIQARHMGLMSAEDIQNLRERLDLSQQEMSDLLQIGAKTYTRWESGRARPSRSMNVLLCALRDGQLDLNYLRAIRDPGKLREWQTGRCNYRWDFIPRDADPQPRGILRIQQGTPDVWVLDISKQPAVTSGAVAMLLESAFGHSNTARSTPRLTAIGSPQPGRPARHTPRNQPAAPQATITWQRTRPHITLDDDLISTASAA